MNVKEVVVKKNPTLMQLYGRRSRSTLMSVRQVIYTTFNLRILWKFSSRGTTGSNWSTVGCSALSGDFSPNNVNTDIVEQQFRGIGANGTTNIGLMCDTQIDSGVYVDTIGILGHNLGVSGTITVDAANDIYFSNPTTLQLVSDGSDNLIWISPTLPQAPFRYWKFTFSDANNPAGYLAVGSIVFGSASLFEGENVVATITKTAKHFSDKVVTEGFTSVSNDRALKDAVGLEFRNLDYSKQNYKLLNQIFNYCRTSLKALWIPTPNTPTRFAVFGKLTTIPSEQHNAISDDADYISLSLEVDESL